MKAEKEDGAECKMAANGQGDGGVRSKKLKEESKPSLSLDIPFNSSKRRVGRHVLCLSKYSILKV